MKLKREPDATYSSRASGRPRLPRSDESDSQEELTETNKYRPANKLRSACVHCKSLKVRCEFTHGQSECQRCKAGGIPCHERQRKKRKAAPTHEELQSKSLEQDAHIQQLLHQLELIKSQRKITTWVSRLTSTSHSPRDLDSKLNARTLKWIQAGIQPADASVSYFGPGQDPSSCPEIVTHCTLFPEEIVILFEIYFEKINPFFSLLDPDLHTPGRLIWNSPFLFTAMCATASRYYTARPELYGLATDFAHDAAAKALIEAPKRIDICQAYSILSVYPVPKKRWANDRSWMFMGVAMRLALELELHLPPPPATKEREKLNRYRTWLNLVCVDGSHATQFGKMPMLELESFLARNSRDWYHSSTMNTPFDVHLTAYVQLIMIMAEWRTTIADGSPQRSKPGFSIASASLEVAEKLSHELNLWVGKYNEELAFKPLLICAYRGNTTQMITAYLRLVVLAAGFRDAYMSGQLNGESAVLKQSVDSARTVIQITVERLFPTGHLRYAMEANFIYVSFAAAYLINLLRPRFRDLLNANTKEDIILTVQRLIEVLGSDKVAIDGRHTPALHSRFLANLLAKHELRSTSPPMAVPSNEGAIAAHSAYSSVDSRNLTWPDVMANHQNSPVMGETAGTFYPPPNANIDLDFSLSHFMRTVTSEQPAQGYEAANWNQSWGSQQAWPSISGFGQRW